MVLEDQTKVNIPNQGFWKTLGKTCGCHQLKERSFHIKGRQLFVCSRCLGIIIGYIFIAPILYFLNLHIGFYSLLLMIPLIIDGSLQALHIIKSNNIRRFITGLLAGYGFGVFIVYSIIQVIKNLF